MIKIEVHAITIAVPSEDYRVSVKPRCEVAFTDESGCKVTLAFVSRVDAWEFTQLLRRYLKGNYDNAT